MKMLFCFFVGLGLIQSASGQSNIFYDRVLGYDDCKNCYFIVIEVHSVPYTGRVVIDNNDLRDYITKTQNIEIADYKSFVKDILANKRKLVLENASLDGDFLSIKNISEQKFRLLHESEKANDIASRGCVQFIKYYFLQASSNLTQNTEAEDCKEFIKGRNKNLSLARKDASSLNEQNAIIKMLFDWEIPVRLNHYSGWLVVDKINFQKRQAVKK